MEEVGKSNSGVNKGPQQMSASLKDRLKRCGRYYSSPTTAKTPKSDAGFLPTLESTSSPSSLNANCDTPTVKRPINETPPCTILTPTSCEDSGFDDSTSLSCTPVLKARDMHTQGSQPRVKRLRLSSRACFNVNFSHEVPPDAMPDEGNKTLPKPGTRLLEEDTSQISASGDAKPRNPKSPEENRLSVVSNVGSQLADGVPKSGDNVLDGESQDEVSAEVVLRDLSCEELAARKIQLQKQLKEKRECLRKLRMVKLYRSKNDLSSLDDLITKWRGVCQQVLLDLHQKLPEPKPTLSGFLQHLNIEQSFLRFNPEEETFD